MSKKKGTEQTHFAKLPLLNYAANQPTTTGRALLSWPKNGVFNTRPKGECHSLIDSK
jgi:hypothetical protein